MRRRAEMRSLVVAALLVACGDDGAVALDAADPTDANEVDAPSSVDSGAGPALVAVGAGDRHTCALRANGTVACWGAGADGRLGAGAMTTMSTAPVDVAGLDDVTALAVGGSHTCVLRATGAVVCWGFNNRLQLGADLGAATSSDVPVAVAGLDGVEVVEIDAGSEHTCVRGADGAVLCWGTRQFGQLGDGMGGGSPSARPVRVTGLADASRISAGQFHTCAVRGTGAAVCWGRDEERLGSVPVVSESATPLEVAGPRGVVAVAAGAFVSCSVGGAGAVFCWGPRARGDGTTTGGGAIELPTLTGAIALSAGGNLSSTDAESHVCAVASAGLSCFGDNADGQLGDGTTAERLTPTRVDLESIASVSAGAHHTCALGSRGVHCWGRNSEGQLGDGTTDSRATPVPVLGL